MQREITNSHPPSGGPIPNAQQGFTLIELIVVIAIMGIILGLITIDFAGQRTARNLKIAQNELVTHIREIQSYTLAARNVKANQPPSYYLMKFDFTMPDRYTVQAIFNIDSAPQLQDIQTIKLPPGIVLAPIITSTASYPVTVTRTSLPMTQNPTSCAVIAFKAPFAKAYMAPFNIADGNCNVASASGYITNTDNYQNILNFVTNTDNSPNPVSTNSTMVIRMVAQNDTSRKAEVLIKGIVGLVCPTKDETNCGL